MTADSTILCRRCGFANTPGDQFCGSCGAFLEWVGQPATEGGPPGGAPVTPANAPGPASDAQAAADGWVTAPGLTPTVPPAATPATPAMTPAAAGSGDLVRCPACGIANAANRTFCQSCGTNLTTASRVVEASPAAIAAAVAAKPKVATTTVAPGSARPAGQAKPAGSRGIPGWLFAVAAIGILVGVGFVVGSQLFAGKSPDTGATTGPNGPSTVPASGVPGQSPGASDGSSPPPSGAPVTLALTGAAASSVVGDKAKFQPGKAIDGDLKTSWQEGSKTEKGQWIEVSFAAARVDTLVIRNGYQASTALYKGNLRLKDIQVSVGGGAPIAFRLKDTTKAQEIDLGGVSGATRVRITIVSTYASQKTSVAGTPFDDAAISEISVVGIPGG